MITVTKTVKACYGGMDTLSLTMMKLQDCFYSSSSKSLKRESATYYYDVLGITPKATHSYQLSKVYHPDSSVGSSRGSVEKFHELTEAYDILGNSLSRKRYDRGLLKSTLSYADNDSKDSTKTDSFRNQRFKGRGPIMTGKTKFYDFDEFYRQHYGEHVLREFKKKQSKQSTEKKTKKHKYLHSENFSDHATEYLKEVKTDKIFFVVVGFLFAATLLIYDSKIIKDLEHSPV